MLRIKIPLLVFAITAASLCADTLTDTTGRSIEVEILEINEDSVEVRRVDGYTFDIPFASLSTKSRERLVQKLGDSKSKEDDYEHLNELLGLDLWGDANLWDDRDEDVAQRLGWPQESKTSTQSSYRRYFRGKASIAGTRPYTAVLYGREGRVDYLSIMFANKGDSVRPGTIEDLDDAYDQINDAIESDLETIRSRLETLGESEKDIGGISRGMKERALRWDYGKNSFWLATVEGEYIALRIMPPELADSWGKPEYQSDQSVRQEAAENVSENEFGDVLIQNIPMVNQGPKGYCVPATIERCLRYMGMRADMYTLAMAGHTNIGGGTSLKNIIEGTSSFVRRSSRDMERFSRQVSTKTVSKYIDRGQPLMWTMFSTDAYNALADRITQARKGAENYKAWKRTLRDILRETPELRKDYNSSHICMIVGYNDKTGEIAVSDSWGPRFELRWIDAEQADAVSQGKFYIIDF
jgi:hypothetical protein